MPADVLCLSHLRWGFVYQRPNHLMSRCARARRVFFVEEPIFDADSPHLVQRPTPEGVIVVVPHLPTTAGETDTDVLLRQLLDGLVRESRIHDPILWFYTPMALSFAGHLNAALTVYDCMDELSLFRGAPPELLHRERELLQRADLVFTGGESLYLAKRERHPHVHAFPSSVDAAHFARARHDQGQGDMALAHEEMQIPSPRIGYVGVVDERIDLDLLSLMADTHRDWQIVVVGPVVKIDVADLPERPNLHYLGGKSYDELPAHLAAWDVAIMPFAENESTRFISPTKTLEYLAAGLPVVSTPIRDVVHPYGEQGLVRIGTGDTFVALVAETLAERGSEAAMQRRRAADSFVAQTSWDRTWSRMAALIDEARPEATRESGPKNETKNDKSVKNDMQGMAECSTT